MSMTANDFGVNDKVVIRRDAEQDTDDLIEYQSAGFVGSVVHVDEQGVVVSFRGDEWRLTANEIELWTPEADTVSALKQQLADVRSELVTFAIVIHQCVGLSELMLVGYDTENGNALLKRAEALAAPEQAGETHG
jgi:hypothetical protein